MKSIKLFLELLLRLFYLSITVLILIYGLYVFNFTDNLILAVILLNSTLLLIILYKIEYKEK